MATFTVTSVRREACPGGGKHIEGVCTSDGTHYTRQQVVTSLNNGNMWRTSGGGYEAPIRAIPRHPRCSATPYIETKPDSSLQDNLENLPDC